MHNGFFKYFNFLFLLKIDNALILLCKDFEGLKEKSL